MAIQNLICFRPFKVECQKPHCIIYNREKLQFLKKMTNTHSCILVIVKLWIKFV